MDVRVESRSFFGQYGQLLKEWCVSAFCSATLDWIASKIPVRNGIFATLLSIGQLTCDVFLINVLLGVLGDSNSRLLMLTDNWLAYNTIILMSPTAVNRLSNSYKKLHFILYGPGRIPQPSDCSTGTCPTSIEANVKPQRELASELPKASETMNQRIAGQWRTMKNTPQ